ncbi:4Fe-4S binding protein [Massilia sp. LXY-6]|uniref:4Fe-4S binding protein n=1 Tax=Massilia sp. LXY-6 TaxID=3379823 RepID=UPI003EE39CC0
MNIRFIEGQGADPAGEARNLLARSAAIAALGSIAPHEPLDTVGYRSAGHTLVIGSAASVLPWADRLAAGVQVTVLLLDAEVDEKNRPPLRIYPVFPARAVVLSGWLGAFQATWQAPGKSPEHGKFDLVLDLGASPQITTHQRPHGYYAPGPDEAARTAAVEQLLEMVGDFEKPKYFSYKERLCAHSRNQLVGCNACIEICSAGAIEGAGDLIKVNPYLCAGCGACTTVCPTGAISYAYPSASDTGSRIKTALRAYQEAGGLEPVLLFHGLEGAALLAQAGDAVPGRLLPLGLHHTASTGIEVWLSALAYGAAGVTVFMTDAEAPQYAAALGQQMEIAQAILDGLGYAGPHLQLLRASSVDELTVALQHAPRGQTPSQRAGFNLAADKRNTLDYALDHLVRHAPAPVQEIALPAGAPFGTLAVDSSACSLCMSCVGACPSSALMDGQNAPQLRFVEKNCVQCGLCATTCPEDAIRLVPRMNLMETRKQTVVLNETQPFHCIRCSKPFGTLRMVEMMLGRLASHPAFAGNLERMRMCGDCRVIDMMTPRDEVSIEQVQELRRK